MTNERSTTPSRSPRDGLRGADERLLRGYGPLVGLAVLLLVLVRLAPTIAPEQLVGGAPTGAPSGATATPVPGTAAGAVPPGQVAGDSPAAGAAAASQGAGIPSVASCPGFQVEADPYSPPCASWPGGNNGGATAIGVDATTVTLSYRDAGLPDPGSLLAQFTGVDDYVSTQADLIRTARVLIDYFNSHYEFYGRQIQLQPFTGQGSALDELFGAGQAGAQADAIKASQEVHAFANMWTLTQPYGDALAANGVIALDNIFMSRDWATQRSGFAWNSLFPDCTKSATAGAELAVNQLVGRPAAFAGDALQDTPRRFGIIAPDSVVFQPCADLLEAALRAAGADVRTVRYTLDLGSLQNQGQQIASSLANDGVTTVLLLTDTGSPLFFTSGAQSIRWTPEWVMLGQPYLDYDWFAQILPREQWSHAFGISFSGQALPPRNTDAYRAYKSQSPETEPATLMLPVLYQELRMLAIGLQMAGPNLTPETLTAGLRAYQSSLGPDGTWAFPDGDYSAPQDFRLAWFDGTAASPMNGQAGAYRDNGQRYTIGNIPTGDPPLFLDGGP